MAEVIEGYVTDEFPSGAYVQIITEGYDHERGFIPSGEIPGPFSGEKKLYVGDYVKAVKIGVHKSFSRNETCPELSIAKLVEKIKAGEIPHPLQGDNVKANIKLDHVKRLNDDPGEKWMKSRRFPPKKAESILLVDDQYELGEKTCKLLLNYFNKMPPKLFEKKIRSPILLTRRLFY